MKVICRCCHRGFDYDMYMGLCPRCGRVYRRGRDHYSAVERDMVGDFHLHADEGGLNRGIHGVVYNQASSESVGTVVDEFDPTPTHRTMINQTAAAKNKKQGGALPLLIFIVVIVLSMLTSIFD